MLARVLLIGCMACDGGVSVHAPDGAGGGGVDPCDAVPAEGLWCSPSSLDFGRVLFGERVTLTVPCTGVSPLAYTLDVFPVNGPQAERFSAVAGPIEVACGHVPEIAVTFEASERHKGANYANLQMQIRNGPYLAPILLVAHAGD